jgi:hypothetical protein
MQEAKETLDFIVISVYRNLKCQDQDSSKNCFAQT